MVSLLQEQLRRLGIVVDIVGLDVGGMVKGGRPATTTASSMASRSSSTDPAMKLDFWLSSGNLHFWNPAQAKPATAWEARIDELMRQQVPPLDSSERQRLFAEVQQVFGEQLPAIYFVAPKVTHRDGAACRQCDSSAAGSAAIVERRHARRQWSARIPVTHHRSFAESPPRDSPLRTVRAASSGDGLRSPS